MKTIKTFLLAGAAMTMLASCNTDTKMSRSIFYPGITLATQGDKEVLSDKTQYLWRVEATNGQTDFEFNASGVMLPDGTDLSYTIKNATYSFDDKKESPTFQANTLSGKDLVPELNGSPLPYTFNSFLTSYRGGVSESTAFGYARYIINGDISVTSIPPYYLYYSRTTITPYDYDGKVFTTSSRDQNLFTVTLNATKKTAEIQINQPKFAENMPSLGTMVLKDIKFSMTHQGFTLDADEVIPTIMNTPHEKFKITKLHGSSSISQAMDMELTFECNGCYVRATLSNSSYFITPSENKPAN